MIGFAERLKRELSVLYPNDIINLVTVEDPELLPIKGAKDRILSLK